MQCCHQLRHSGPGTQVKLYNLFLGSFFLTGNLSWAQVRTGFPPKCCKNQSTSEDFVGVRPLRLNRGRWGFYRVRSRAIFGDFAIFNKRPQEKKRVLILCSTQHLLCRSRLLALRCQWKLPMPSHRFSAVLTPQEGARCRPVGCKCLQTTILFMRRSYS